MTPQDELFISRDLRKDLTIDLNKPGQNMTNDELQAAVAAGMVNPPNAPAAVAPILYILIVGAGAGSTKWAVDHAKSAQAKVDEDTQKNEVDTRKRADDLEEELQKQTNDKSANDAKFAAEKTAKDKADADAKTATDVKTANDKQIKDEKIARDKQDADAKIEHDKEVTDKEAADGGGNKSEDQLVPPGDMREVQRAEAVAMAKPASARSIYRRSQDPLRNAFDKLLANMK